jgi:hypothetical protein
MVSTALIKTRIKFYWDTSETQVMKRKMPNKIASASALADGFEQLIGVKGTLKDVMQTYGRAASYTDQVARSIVEANKGHVKRIAANSASTIDAMMQSIEENVDKVNYHIAGKIDQTHKHLVSSITKAGETKASKFMQARESIIGNLATKGSERLSVELVDSIKEIASSVGRLAPAIAMFGSLALVVKMLVDRIFDLNKASTELSLTYGGNVHAANDFISGLEETISATNLTKEQLIDFGKSFQQAGIPIVGNTKQLHEFMTVAGNLHRVLGTGIDALAKYTRTLKQTGFSSDEIYDSYDAMYRMMQKFQLTLTDFNASMSEGDALWSQFGALAGKTLDKMQRDILDTKGMFRAFNVDIKNTGSLLAGIWGDPKTQMRQAGLIASMMKVRGSTAYNELIMNPKQGMQDLMKSAVRFMHSFPDLHMGENDQDLMTKYGSDQLTGILRSRQALLSHITNQFQVPQEMLSQALSDFASLKRQYPGKGLDEWTGKRLLENTLPGKTGSLAEAKAAMDKSIEGAMQRANNGILAIVDNVAMLVNTQLPAIIGNINKIVDIAEGFASKFKVSDISKGVGGVFAPGIKNLTRPDFLNLRNIGQGTVKLQEKLPAPMILHGGVQKESTNTSFIDSKELNKYRTAQGLGIRGLHANFMDNARDVLKAAKQLGADPATMIATMIQESGGNATIKGDGGHSHGLFQLNDWGKGHGLSLQYKQDAFNNAIVAGREMATLRRAHPEWSAGHVAAAAQRPMEYIKANKAGLSIEGTDYAKSVNAMIPFAQKIVRELQEQKQQIANLVDIADKNGQLARKGMEEIKLKSMINNRQAEYQQHFVHSSLA